MKNLLIISILILTASCKKEDSMYFPLSERAKSLIPANQDSVLFTDELDLDSTYLAYSAYTSSRFYANTSSGSSVVEIERITQQAKSLNNSFELTFVLETSVPKYGPAGDLYREETLFFMIPGFPDNYIKIVGDTISTSLHYYDTLEVSGNSYLNVFSDHTNFYFSTQDGIIRYLNGNTWLNLDK